MTNSVQQDLHLLYQLSLSIGESLDLSQNCSNFCQSLMNIKGMSISSVWFKEPNSLKSLYAFPKVTSKESVLKLNNSFYNELKRAKYLIIDDKNDFFKLICTEHKITKGTYLLFYLEDFGLLKLYNSQEK